MRSSYFLLFTLAAILPGLMLGAVLSRATSGTAAGALSVEAPAWPAPLEAGLASVPSPTPGLRGSEFGTKPALGSSEEPSLALMELDDAADLEALIPAQPLTDQGIATLPVDRSASLPQPLPLQAEGQAASQQLAALQPSQPVAPQAPAPPALPQGLPAPLKLEPLALPSVKPLQPLTPKAPAVQLTPKVPDAPAAAPATGMALGLPNLPTLTPAKPGLAPAPQVASLPQPAEITPSLSADTTVALARAPKVPNQVFAFDPKKPASWLADVETPGYRPPQFVLLSFEAASRNVFWDTSQDLAAEAQAQVTYFISASSLVLATRADAYTAPTGESGRAWLGFAKGREELAGRLQRIQDALSQGHDVAVQGVGYHRGQGWSIEQWQQELSQTEALVRGAYRDNGLSEPAGWQAMAERLLSGFRAREQSGSDVLNAALSGLESLRYNASGKQASAAWPRRDQEGVWQLGVPTLSLDGSRRVLAQDYDFYLKQTNGQPNSAKSAEHEEQMLNLLLAELDQRYQAGRAPMLVSLHFALWNKGAYWRAVKRFAKRVCDQPEVVCTTHTAMVDYLDAVGEAKLARLAAADFPRFTGAGLSLESPQALSNLSQVASLDKDQGLASDNRGLDAQNAQAASATAARLLSDAPEVDVKRLMAGGYVFDRLPQGLPAPLPAVKPLSIARKPTPQAVPAPPSAKANAPKLADKPLPLPFAEAKPSTGTRSASSDDALY